MIWRLLALLLISSAASAQTAYLYDTAALPAALVGTFVEGKFRVFADQGSDTAQPVMVITPNVTVQMMYSDLTSGTTMQCSSYNGGTQQTANFASRPAVGRWFYAWIAINSTASNGVLCGWMYADNASASVYVTTTLDSPPSAATGVYYGFRSGGSYIQEDVADLRIYDAGFAAIPDQVYWNRYNFVPVFPADLVASWPCLGGTLTQALTDYSGHGHTLQYSGSPAPNLISGDPALPQFGRGL
jgi:hypothetical protein